MSGNMATASREIVMVSNNGVMITDKKPRRLLYNEQIVSAEEVQYYLNELSRQQDTTEIILLLCEAGDLLDNILEKLVEEDKEEKCRQLIDVALKKLEGCENNPQMENRATITRFEKMFMKLKRDFERRTAMLTRSRSRGL